MDYVTVLTVDSTVEAEIVLGLLRSAGVDALSEPHANYTEEPTHGAEGNVHIRVPEGSETLAQEVLATR